MAHPNVHPVIAVQGGGATAAPTLLGQGPARIPTGGKIRAGIKVLTKKAAGEPKEKAIYEQGVVGRFKVMYVHCADLEVTNVRHDGKLA